MAGAFAGRWRWPQAGTASPPRVQLPWVATIGDGAAATPTKKAAVYFVRRPRLSGTMPPGEQHSGGAGSQGCRHSPPRRRHAEAKRSRRPGTRCASLWPWDQRHLNPGRRASNSRSQRARPLHRALSSRSTRRPAGETDADLIDTDRLAEEGLARYLPDRPLRIWLNELRRVYWPAGRRYSDFRLDC